MKPTLLTLLVCTFIGSIIFAQTPPSNNNPADAIDLTVSPDSSCSGKIAGTTVNATSSAVAAPSCGSTPNADVWYKVTVPTSGNLTIETFRTLGSFFVSALTVYSGAPGNLTEIDCDISNSSINSKLALTGQTSGDTLYIRVWNQQQWTRGAFEICTWDLIFPTNNDLSGAIPLTVSSGSCSGNTEAGTTVEATNSGEGGTPSCGTGINLRSDVWYQVDVPNSGNLAIETFDASGSFDSVLTVYSGSPGNLTEVGCDVDGGSADDLSKLILRGQTGGTTLYIRVWGFYGDQKPFEICAWEPLNFPANDNPEGAIILPVGSGSCSGNEEASTTEEATNSGVTAPSCGAYLSSDVWYQVTVPTSGNLIVETFNVSGSSFNPVLTAYSGSPKNLTEVSCDNDSGSGVLSKLVFKNQNAGEVLYIRVWGLAGNRKPFEICAWDSTPTNNNPTGATLLAVGSGSCDGNTETGSTEGATDSGEGTPSCGSSLDSDVWYRAIVPNSGNLAIETYEVPGNYFDTVITAYSGAPGKLTEVSCGDEGSSSDGLSKLVLTGQTAGDTLYFRVHGYGNYNDQKPFEICAWEPLTFPANNDPTSATDLPVGSGSCENTKNGSTDNATNSGVGTFSCGIDISSDVWYKTVVPNSGNLAIETFGSFNSVLTAYSGTLGSLTEVGCNDNGGSGNLSKLVLRGQTAGDTLYVRVWGYRGDRASFSICAWAPPPTNNNPTGATDLTVGTGSCSGNTVAGSTDDATNSGEGGTPICGSGVDSDVWYKVAVPASGNLALETFDVSGGSFDSVLTAYSGTLGSLTEVGCDDNGGSGNLSKLILTGQAANTALYIRVWGSNGNRGQFDICASDPQNIPTNNNPMGATVLPLSSDSLCNNKKTGSTEEASNSGEGGTPNCGAGLSADVWYQVTVPNSGNLTIETFDVSGSFNSVLTAYSGALGNLTAMGCDDDGSDSGNLSKLVLTNQTPSTKIYIRVWGYKGNRESFEICAWEPQTFPTNNDPTGATDLDVGTSSCSGKKTGSTEVASNSGVGTPSCGTGLGSDVWYKVAVPTSGNLAIETFDVGGSFDSVLTVYSGSPGNLTEVSCDNDGSSGNLSKLILTGQTVNTTLYIRVWGSNGDRNSFEICAWDPQNIPANNNPMGAISLTVGSGSCSGNIEGSTEVASSSGVGAPNCGADFSSDVWYTAIVPASENLTIETSDVSGSSFDSVLTVYSGSPGSLTEIACDDNDGLGSLSKLVLTGQTANTTLYIRVWGYGGNRGRFEICAWAPPPANNNPMEATVLSVGSGSCSVKRAGTTMDATNSGVAAPSCGGTLSADVWYQVNVPSSGNLAIETFNKVGSSFDSVVTVYSGSPSTTLKEVACDDNGGSGNLSKLMLTGQTAGDTLYVRVWGLSGNQDSFEICAWSPPPVNNDSTGATVLSVGSGSCSGKSAGTIVDASNSGEGGTPSCGGIPRSDVWYKVTVPNSGNLTVETFNAFGSSFDTVLAAYSNASGSFMEAGCDNEGAVIVGLSKLVLTSQTPGDTLYIRVWGYRGNQAAFEICTWDPMPLSKVDIAQQTFEVYPNPTKGILHIDRPNDIDSVTVYDLTGAKVLSTDLPKNNAELDVSNLPAGIYLLRITHEEGNNYIKFLKE